MSHKHRVKFRGQAWGFTRQIPMAIRVNPRAHGCVAWEETCSCGAQRAVNANGGSREVGPWMMADASGEMVPS